MRHPNDDTWLSPDAMVRECDEAGCSRPFSCRGRCRLHYDQWRREGRWVPADRTAAVHHCSRCGVRVSDKRSKFCQSCAARNRYPDEAERFWRRVDVAGPSECWRWTGALHDGYGAFKVTGPPRRMVGAHRYSYIAANGPLESWQHLDHRCHTEDATCAAGDACIHRSCVNPAHLDVVTATENIRRRDARLPDACHRGHPWTDESVRIATKHGRQYRCCLICEKLTRQIRNARAKAATS